MDSRVSVFSTAVQAVVDQLAAAGSEVLEAAFNYEYTPHVVAEANGQLHFILVQAFEGPHLAQFSEELYQRQLRPVIDGLATHPKAVAVARLAAENGGLAELVSVCVLTTDQIDAEGNSMLLAKVFPFREIDAEGRLSPPRPQA